MREGCILARRLDVLIVEDLGGGGDGVRTGVLKKSAVIERGWVGVDVVFVSEESISE